MIYNFKDSINDTSVATFLDFMNSIQVKAVDEAGNMIMEPVQLFLSSDGGNYELAMVMVDVINNFKGDLELIGYWSLMSAAFDLFFKVERSKRMLPGTMGMYHLATSHVMITEGMQNNGPGDKALIESMNDLLDRRTKPMFKLTGMDKTEQKRVLKGEDVFFSHKRMLELYNHNVARKSK